ncbi:MAG: methyltransferase domain-containing protein [Alphaproteobacteria bacterium]|nr:methyltransferase domain-containing protein [Alphaproteobacteria bacterium]
MNDNNPFDGLAARYQANRPDYPESLLAALSARAPDSPLTAADIGAGTGISTRALQRGLGAAWTVTGIEPGSDMRRQAIESTPEEDGIAYLDGSAESLPFSDGSLGIVNVGQAIQFFDRPVFFEEVRRVLAPGGLLSIIQNNRVWQQSPLLDAHESLIETNDPTYSRNYRDIDLQHELDALEWSAEVERIDESWERIIDADRFVGMMLSRSTMKPTVAKRGEAAVEESLRSMATEFGNADRTVTIPYVTELFLATKMPSA